MGGQLKNIAKLVNLDTINSIEELYKYVGSIALRGGILEYTRGNYKSKYITKYIDGSANLTNLNLGRNFGTGARLIEDSSNITSNVFYKYDDTGEHLDEENRPHVNKLSVGMLYNINTSEGDNSLRKIITEDGFYFFEKKIRERQLLNWRKKEFIKKDEIFFPHYYGDTYSKEKVKKINWKDDYNWIMSDKERGLKFFTLDFIYNANDDESYKHKIKADLSSKGILGTINKWHFYENPEKDGAGIEIYAVDDKNVLGSRIETIKFEGSFSEIKNGNRNISFYDEKDEPGGQAGENVSLISVTDGVSDLMKKTNEIFSKIQTQTLINRFHTNPGRGDDSDNSELVTSSSKYGISRGRNLLTKEAETGENENKTNKYDNPYCRVWTSHHQYNKLSRRIRPLYNGTEPVTISDTQIDYGDLRPNGSNHLGAHTVLTDQGFVRITPTSDHSKAEIKNCMFSIENLAWRDVDKDNAGLSPEQRGPNGGRIMWFPPYNLKFTENVNVDWNANKFIGRGEQIYTYTNTDRSGTLSFTLLIDHPSVLNKFSGKGAESEVETDILRFFAGCQNLEGSTVGGDVEDPQPEDPNVFPNNPKEVKRSKDIAIIAFFPNNWSGSNYKENLEDGLERLRDYETPSASGYFNESDTGPNTFGEYFVNNDNESKYNLNTLPSDEAKESIKSRLFSEEEDIEIYSVFDINSGITKLSEIIKDDVFFGYGNASGGTKDFEIKSVTAFGCASTHGKEVDKDNSKNNRLGLERIKFLWGNILNKCETIPSTIVKGGFIHEILDAKDVGERNINSLDAKIARSAYVIFHIEWKDCAIPSDSSYANNTYSVYDYGELNHESEKLEEMLSKIPDNTNEAMKVETEEDIADKFSYDNEYKYFLEKRDDEMVYRYIAKKIQYFDPAFHSITPEGFNARLTFLHQCTRQGPTVDLSSGQIDKTSNSYLKYAGNLAFGRPPYCILRIGDFYHTKICITSMSINYDVGDGIQWDLNQEGIGVQPMFANVDLNFYFIGGQDLENPIERLQNAVTSNYYANASVYDRKADVYGGTPYDPSLNLKNEKRKEATEIIKQEGEHKCNMK